MWAKKQAVQVLDDLYLPPAGRDALVEIWRLLKKAANTLNTSLEDIFNRVRYEGSEKVLSSIFAPGELIEFFIRTRLGLEDIVEMHCYKYNKYTFPELLRFGSKPIDSFDDFRMLMVYAAVQIACQEWASDKAEEKLHEGV